MHFKKLFDKDTIGAHNLTDDNDRPLDVTLTISRIEVTELPSRSRDKGPEKKPVFWFKERPNKRMICNITNAEIIAKLYGNDVNGWIGKAITLYSGTTRDPKGGTCQGVMVRPNVPKARGAKPGGQLRDVPVDPPPAPASALPADWPACSCGAPVTGTDENPGETCGAEECGGAA